MASFVGVGCMSGSSLDGLDMCCVEFTGDMNFDLWGYRILKAETIAYTAEWRECLSNAANLSGCELLKLHTEYGIYVGKHVSSFIEKNELDNVQFVASHGHSIFHQPEDGFTFQLGEGEATSTYFKVPYVTNFRSKDVCLGGQGAPLVPCGEKYLFRNDDICINLGGIANIGILGSKGYDVCPCNIVLNRLATIFNQNLQFDQDGELARKGRILPKLLDDLENIPFYKEEAPKSLWKEYINKEIFPLFDTNNFATEDLLRTACEHIACRVADACLKAKSSIKDKLTGSSILVTGGGALNKFLLELIQAKLEGSGYKFQPVDEMTINFKEALVFAFLGLRCLLGRENVFNDITGAKADTISGTIHRPMSAGARRQISMLT